MDNIAHSMKTTYRGKKVLITGHTGFKGTWLAQTLLNLGAEVYGIGLEEEKEKIFQLSQTAKDMSSHIQDIRAPHKTRELIQKIDPPAVFHLAAQTLVLKSYEDPVGTHASKYIMGTAHVLRLCGNLQAVVFITTDKVYYNNEWAYPYRETDRLGGRQQGCL